MRRIGGVMQIGYMLAIAISGNLAFLNWETMIPAFACLDDGLFQFFGIVPNPAGRKKDWWNYRLMFRVAMDSVLAYFVLTASWPVVDNLLQISGKQVMNASFGPWKIVNTYGAFGSVGHARFEPVVAASHDGKTWHEFEFKCKPTTLSRRPCSIQPYHHRLDWNIWFIG